MIQKINNGITGAEAAEIIYLNDIQNSALITDNTTPLVVMQLFNGAILEDFKTLKIPAGSTGGSSTFEITKKSKTTRVVYFKFTLKSEGLPISELVNADYTPRIPGYERTIILNSDFKKTYLVKFPTSQEVEINTFFQVSDNASAKTQDAYLTLENFSYWEMPIGQEPNDFPAEYLENKTAFKNYLNDYSTGGEYFNGAIKTSTGFLIPAGSSGYQSYLDLALPNGGNYESTVEFKLHVGADAFTNYNITLNLQGVAKETTSISDGVYLVRVKYSGTNNNLYIQKTFGNSPMPENTQVYIDDVNIAYTDTDDAKTSNQIAIEEYVKAQLHNPRKLTVITCAVNGVAGIDADFIGRNCIQDAIDSITDASEDNRYAVYVKNGFYYVLNSTEYKGNPGYPAMVCMRNYIDLVGESEQGVIIYAELPENDADVNTSISRDQHQTLWNWAECEIKNLTFIGKNIRYTIHQDSAFSANTTRRYENVTVKFEGNKGYLRCFGLGTVTGEKNYLKNVTMISTFATFSCHSNTNFQNPAYWSLEGCTLTSSSEDGFYVQSNGALKDCEFNFIGNNLPVKFEYNELWLHGNPANNLDAWNHSETKITGYGNSAVEFVNKMESLNLRIKSKTAGVGSSVVFDELSTAFDILIKDKHKTKGHPTESKGRYFVKNGYYTLQGSAELSAFAFGCVDVSGVKAAYDPQQYTSLGKRLGNCSVNNKILGVRIDGNLVSIVFNQDYTNMSNADILAQINGAINTWGVADLYNFAKEYYLEFSDVLGRFQNRTGAPILKGSVVKISGNLLSLADNWEGQIGVALEDIPTYTAGSISSSYHVGRVASRALLPIAETNAHYIKCQASNIPNGSGLGLSGGIVVLDPASIKKAFAQNVIEV